VRGAMGVEDAASEDGESDEELQVEDQQAARSLSSPSLFQSLRERGGRPAVAEEEGMWLADRPLLYGDQPEGTTEGEATLNLLNSLLGNSLLVLPWAFAQVGMMLGIVLLFVGTALNWYTLHLLLKHVDMCNSGSYPKIGRCAYGWAGEAAVLAVYLMVSGGAMCAYAVGLADLMTQLVEAVGLGVIPRAAAGLLAVAVCTPGMFQMSMKKVAKFSALNMAASVLFCLVLASFVFTLGGGGAAARQPEVHWARPEHVLVAWPIFGYVFAVQPSGVMVLSKFEAKNLGAANRVHEMEVAILQEARRRISMLAYIISVIVGSLIGISSYAQFGEFTRGNILINVHESQAYLWPGAITTLRLCSSVMLLSSAAFVMFPFRFAVLEIMRILVPGDALASTEEEAPVSQRKRVTWGMLAIMCLVASLCDDISTVYRVVGTFATQVFALILPGAFALKLVQGTEGLGHKVGPFIVTVLGVCALFMCVVHVLDDTST